MKKKSGKIILKNLIVCILSFLIIFSGISLPDLKAEAKGKYYWTTDVFTLDRPIKGTTSYLESEIVNTSNIIVNAFIDDGFIEDNATNTVGYTPYEFEGETYYFKVPEDLYNASQVSLINSYGYSVTVVLLVRYDSSKLRLIEPTAIGNGNAFYYAPNMSDEKIVKEYRAFMDFMADIFSNRNSHIDCWVVGNEVNAPDRWNFFGSDCMSDLHGTDGDGKQKWAVSNQHSAVDKYVKWYDIVYDSVKSRNTGARVCISVDHCWNTPDQGRIIPTKNFLDMFAAREGNDKNWCIAFHCYPSNLYQTAIWADGYFNPKNESAQFIDGYNLEIFTGYVKRNFGTNHRIMLTEQGFSDAQGPDKQAACMVYTYYKAKFDDMVDVFHIMKFPGCGFVLSDKAANIWKYLDDGSDAHEQEIFNQVRGTLNVNSWTDIVPNWRPQSSFQAEINAYREANKYMFEGVDLSPVFDYDFYTEHYPDILRFYSTDPVNNPPSFYEIFQYFTLYGMSYGHQGSANFNLQAYKDTYPDLVEKFGDSNVEYYKYYSLTYDVDENAIGEFVTRFYSLILGREPEQGGIDYWTEILMFKELNASEVANGFVNSPEFLGRNCSDEEFVNIMYSAFFDREGGDGVDYWVKLLKRGYSRGSVLAGFTNSDEFGALCKRFGIKQGSLPMDELPPANQENNQQDDITKLNLDSTDVDPEKLDAYVKGLYTQILGRDFDESGLEYWIENIMSGETYDAATAARVGFFESEEYTNMNKTSEQFVTDCYHAFLGRDPEPAGLEYWMNKLDSGEYSKQKVIDLGFGHSEEFKGILTNCGFRIIE